MVNLGGTQKVEVGSSRETDRFSTSPGAELTFWVRALVMMGWVIGRNRSIQHKSGRRVDCWGAALVVMGWVAGRNRSFQHKSGRRHLWHLIVSETMGSALRARADVRW